MEMIINKMSHVSEISEYEYYT